MARKFFLFNARLKLFPGKLQTRWLSPFVVINVFSHGAVEIKDFGTDKTFKANGHILKPFYDQAYVQMIEDVTFEEICQRIENVEPTT